MVTTLQDIQKREEELNKVEVEAQRAQRTRIPERKYGFSVTKQNQQEAYARRAEGKRVLGEVNKQREELKSFKQEVIAYNQRQEEIRRLEEKRAAYQRGFDLAYESDPRAVFALMYEPVEARQGYQDAKDYQQYRSQKAAYDKQISDLKAQGLTPVYSGGKLTGFEDVVRGQSIGIEQITKLPSKDLTRYEKAGLITRELKPQEINTFNLRYVTTQKGVMLESDAYYKAPISTYKPFFGKVENVIQYPFEKLALLSEKQKRYQDAKYEYGFGIIRPLKEGEVLEPSKQPEPRAIRFLGEFASYPFYGPRRIEELSFDPVKRQEFKEMSALNKGLDVLNIGLSTYSFGSITKSVFKIANKPINLKKELPVEKNYANTKIINIRTPEGRVLNIGQFEVVSISKSIKVYQIPRWSKVIRGVKANDVRLEKYSMEELKLLFPEGRVLELKPLRVTRSITEPFFVQNGKIVSSTQGLRKPGVFTYRTSYFSTTGRTRIYSKDVSLLSGQSKEMQSLNTISKSKKELPVNTRKALEELEKIPSPEGIKAKRVYSFQSGKELPKLDVGELKLEKVLKLTNKELKVIKPGKRTTRADVTTIQESTGTIEYSGKGALKEREFLREDIGAIDVTFPRFRTPKKVIRIKGKTERLEYEIPSESDKLSFGKRFTKQDKVKPIQELKLDNLENQKTIQKAIGEVAVKQAQVKEAKIKLPSEKTGVQDLKNAFSSALPSSLVNVQAKETPSIIEKPLEQPRLAQEFSIKTKNINLEIPRYTERTINKEINKEIAKDINKEISKELPKLISKSVTKQTPKQISKSINKLAPKNAPAIPRGIGRTGSKSKTTKSKKPFLIKFPSSKILEGDLVPGYKPYIIKGGKKEYLGGILPKEGALLKGSKKVLNTLRATFGIEKTKVKVKEDEKTYTPPKNIFRSFRIRGGKKIPLTNEFIQRAGKRLSSRGEITEIQLARLNKR